jgi:hypothetical protein
MVVAHFSALHTLLCCFTRLLSLSLRLRRRMSPEASQLFAGEFFLQIAAVRSSLFLWLTGKFIRTSQSTGIFSVMERTHFDRNIRVEVFQILQLEIEGRKKVTVGQYLMLKVLEKFNAIRVRTNKIRMRPRYR